MFLSTRLQTRHNIVGSRADYSTAEFLVSSEVWSGDHKSCARNADISCGYVAGVCLQLTPERHNEGIWAGVNPPVNLGSKSVEAHLIYCINKRLSIISGDICDPLDLTTVREDARDQIDALIHGKGGVD